MKPLRPLCLSLGLLLCALAFAHDPLPTNWGTGSNSILTEIGTFEIGASELQAALAEEEARVADCAAQNEEQSTAQSPVLSRTTSVRTTATGTYWQYPQPLNSCGVVLHDHNHDWCAATNLARRKCEQISAALGVWPPAIPFVNAPASYNEQNVEHHDVYRIEHGRLTGICVAEISAASTPTP